MGVMGPPGERRSLPDGEEEEEEEDDEEMSPLKLRKLLEQEGGEQEEAGLELPGPPDGGWGWVVVVASFLCNMILDGIAYSFGVLLAPLCRYFDAPAGTVSWVGSLLCGIYLMSGPIVGGLVNKYGCRPVCMAGSVITAVAFSLSTLSTNVPMLMLTYGVLGGFGLGLIYLPSVVAVGYYFESKRALATGISVCGSGVGTFIFAPLASYLLEQYGWRGANIIFAALCLQCAVFGALMRPLTLGVLVEEEEEEEPVLKMKLPDGQSVTGFRHLIAPSEASTGDLASPSLRIPPLPTITEQSVTAAHSKKDDHHSVQDVFPGKPAVTRKVSVGKTRFRTTSECVPEGPLVPLVRSPASSRGKIPRNQSAPHFAQEKRNSSTTFTPMARVGSTLGYSIGSGSQLQVEGAGSVKTLNLVVRPLARKDIFYSRSIYSVHQQEAEHENAQAGGLRPNTSYISMQQGLPTGLRSNKQSFVSIHRGSLVNSALGLPVGSSMGSRQLSVLSDAKAASVVPGGGGMLAVLKEMMNFKLLADPLFLLIGISNAFAMIGFYTPFVYLPSMAMVAGVSTADASFLVSIIGISNTLGRVLAGWVSDFKWVNSLVMTNVAIILSAITVAVFPLCSAYWNFVVCALAFGFFVAAYISLTSIILVDLMGLDNLTSAFGLLTLFRGFSSMIGPPINGWIFEATEQYNVSFFVSGGFLMLAGLISCLVDLLKRRRARERAVSAGS